VRAGRDRVQPADAASRMLVSATFARYNSSQASDAASLGRDCPDTRVPRGAIAQLGERLNGIQEVRGSTPLGSTI
jgi:hypothetical protein